jgi:hypothetical protein
VWPSRTRSTAASNTCPAALFDTNPWVPACWAARAICCPSCIESMSMGTSGRKVLIRLATAKPSRSGIVTSRMIRSGSSSDALSIASCPFAASPQISTVLRDSNIEHTPLRTVTWSSTTSIRKERSPMSEKGSSLLFPNFKTYTRNAVKKKPSTARTGSNSAPGAARHHWGVSGAAVRPRSQAGRGTAGGAHGRAWGMPTNPRR